jgi:thiamine biosynthesis lipoprotein ApbE
MVADGLGTAAMVLGPLKGLDLIEGQGAEGLIITRDLQSFATPGFAGLTTASTPPARVHRTSVA